MGTLGDVKDIAIIGLLGVGAFLIFDAFRGGKTARGLGEGLVGGAAQAAGDVLAGGFAEAQSLITGQPKEEIYEHVETGIDILNEMSRDWRNWIPVIGPMITGWTYSGAGGGAGQNVGE